MKSASLVAQAFQRSAPYVEKLSIEKGPFEKPAEELIEKVAGALWERRGKRIRSHIVYWSGELVGIEPEALALYAWAAEAVHTATLLHDDVVDQADVRRGGPSANRLYDNTLPVLSGDYLMADVLYQVAAKGNSEILLLLCQTLKDLVSGEALQYEMRYTVPANPEIFYEIVKRKTASLFRWGALVGPILIDHPNRLEIEQYIDRFGILFQFSDDVLDVLGSSTKERWTDLKNGTLNIVTWRLCAFDALLKKQVLQAFRDRNINEELCNKFARHSSLNEIVNEVRRELKRTAEEARSFLKGFPRSQIREALMELPGVLVDRCI